MVGPASAEQDPDGTEQAGLGGAQVPSKQGWGAPQSQMMSGPAAAPATTEPSVTTEPDMTTPPAEPTPASTPPPVEETVPPPAPAPGDLNTPPPPVTAPAPAPGF